MARTTSETAFCHDCDWTCQERNSRRRAYEHTKATGHRTNAEVTKAYHYGPSRSVKGRDSQ